MESPSVFLKRRGKHLPPACFVRQKEKQVAAFQGHACFEAAGVAAASDSSCVHAPSVNHTERWREWTRGLGLSPSWMAVHFGQIFCPSWALVDCPVKPEGWPGHLTRTSRAARVACLDIQPRGGCAGAELITPLCRVPGLGKACYHIRSFIQKASFF